MAAPSVALALPSGAQTVTFTLGRLAAIETAIGVGAVDLAQQLAEYMPATKDGQVDPASLERVMKASKVSFMAPFVAACLGVGVDKLEETLGGMGLWAAFYRLAVGYFAAVMDMQGKAEAAEGKSEPSAASGPGPASSSASAPASSTSSGPASSAT